MYIYNLSLSAINNIYIHYIIIYIHSSSKTSAQRYGHKHANCQNDIAWTLTCSDNF